jgi:nitrogenase molybdenum-iron protein alpha/beta subunit
MIATETAVASPSRFSCETRTSPMYRDMRQDGWSVNRQNSSSASRNPAAARVSCPMDADADCTNSPQERVARSSIFFFGGTLSLADLAYLNEILDAHGLDGSMVVGVDASQQMGLKCHRLAMPIGIARTDEFLQTLATLSSSSKLIRFKVERDRLVMRLASNNRLFAHRRVVVYGEEIDFVAGMVSLLLEAGMLPVLCASRCDSDQLRRALEATTPELQAHTAVVGATQFCDLQGQIQAARPDVLIANRHACQFAERTRIPLVCAGHPQGGQNEKAHFTQIGYRGALQLLDRLQMALQESSG